MTTPVPIFILMGTAGCGKSSVAAEMQKILGCEYIEGDVFHPQTNIDKMASGHPLTDDDRWPWLGIIRDELIKKAKSSPVVIATCSSLRKAYRDILSDVPAEIGQVWFVYLKGTPELLLKRIQGRQGHFMPALMLQSQLDALEVPDETVENVIVASIEPTPDVEAKHILKVAYEKGLFPNPVV